MASIFGHTASIFGIKKLFPDSVFDYKIVVLGIVSAVMPDIDVIGYSYGISDGWLGHRGFTHSLLFALAWALLLFVIFHKSEKDKFILLTLFYFCCAASHGLLDAMTTGGDGITFFIPVTFERYFLPWRFIQVSPIGASHFFSEWGVKVLISEFKYIGVPTLLLYGFGFLLNKKVYKS